MTGRYILPLRNSNSLMSILMQIALLFAAVARAARKFSGKKEGFVVVPVQVTNSDLVEQFRSVLEVVRAMVEQDMDLMKELRNWVILQGKRIGVEGDDGEEVRGCEERSEATGWNFSLDIFAS